MQLPMILGMVLAAVLAACWITQVWQNKENRKPLLTIGGVLVAVVLAYALGSHHPTDSRTPHTTAYPPVTAASDELHPAPAPPPAAGTVSPYYR